MNTDDLRLGISSIVADYGEVLEFCAQEYFLCFPASELPHDWKLIAGALKAGLLDPHFSSSHDAFKCGFINLPFFVPGDKEQIVRRVSAAVMPHFRKHQISPSLANAQSSALVQTIGMLSNDYSALLRIHSQCVLQQGKALEQIKDFMRKNASA